MKHELECTGWSDFGIYVEVCVCKLIRNVRRKAREDAAQAVLYVIDEEHPRGIDWMPTKYEASLIAAARGDGEQA